MTVDELRTILEHLPGDLPVVMPRRGVAIADHGRGEVWSVRRRNGRVLLGDGMVALRIEPGIQLSGPFRRRAELDRRLDALTLDAAPESEA